MRNLSAWLEGPGLGQYTAVFTGHAIDRKILAELTDEDLEKIGIPLGHRKKLLRAIVALASGAAGDAGSAASSATTVAPAPALDKP